MPHGRRQPGQLHRVQPLAACRRDDGPRLPQRWRIRVSNSDSRNRYSDTSGSSPATAASTSSMAPWRRSCPCSAATNSLQRSTRHVVETGVGQLRHHQGIGQQEIRQCLRFRTHCQQRANHPVHLLLSRRHRGTPAGRCPVSTGPPWPRGSSRRCTVRPRRGVGWGPTPRSVRRGSQPVRPPARPRVRSPRAVPAWPAESPPAGPG